MHTGPEQYHRPAHAILLLSRECVRTAEKHHKRMRRKREGLKFTFTHYHLGEELSTWASFPSTVALFSHAEQNLLTKCTRYNSPHHLLSAADVERRRTCRIWQRSKSEQNGEGAARWQRRWFVFPKRSDMNWRVKVDFVRVASCCVCAETCWKQKGQGGHTWPWSTCVRSWCNTHAR